MSEPSFDRDSWERRWERVLREHPEKVASRAPNEHLVREVGELSPGRALDAGCGHGAEAIWLAAAGWQVTAVDFSVTALDLARSTVRALGPGIADRVEWVEGDLATWTPEPAAYDLVSCLYVHVAGSVGGMVARLGAGVASRGTLFLVGHLPLDPASGLPSPAAGQVQVTVGAALDALDPSAWQIVVAEERRRAAAGTGADAVVRAVRRPVSSGG